MKILAIILIIFSLTKLCIVGSNKDNEFSTELQYQVQNNLEDFQSRVILILIIDGIIGILCGIAILF